MNRASITCFRSFRSTLMAIVLAAFVLPVLFFSPPLIEKIYRITKEDALNELRLRAEQLAGDLSHQLELTATKLVMLGETSDVVIASYSTLFRGLAARYMFQFKDDNGLVLAVYLLDDSLLVAEAAPASAEAVDLPEPVFKAAAKLLRQPPEEVQSKYLFAAFTDRHFMEQNFQALVGGDKRKNVQRRFACDHGLAALVPLVEKIGEGSGRKEMKGVLVAILPAEYLTARLAALVGRPASFFFSESSGKPLFNSSELAEGKAKKQISSETQLMIRSIAGNIPALSYRIAVSEPEAVRFAEANRTLRKVSALFFAALAGLLVLSCCVAKLLVSPLQKMKRIVNQYAAGNYHYTEKVFFSEFRSVAEVLERMGLKILEQFNELKLINQAYARFVPNDLLNHLDKKSIIDVQLGDHVQRHMSVMFADIRNFTAISERMTPEENFRFVNSVLNRTGPIIRDHSGFIDKYIGDSIMALFDERPDHAIQAGIAMLRELEAHNEEIGRHGSKPVRIGIGINTGELMLGTIGEHGRMEGTVISDAVNLASRLEGLTKIYGASMLISDQTFYNLANPGQFHVRMVDLVTVKGKNKPVTVFEVIDGEEQEVKKKKLQTKDMFEHAVSLYREQEFTQAVRMMREVVQQHPEDKAAMLYIERCENSIRFGTDGGWNGVTKLNEK